jgi:hypothetical protein
MAAKQPNVEEIYAGTAMLNGWKKNRGGTGHGSLPFKLPDPPMKCVDPEQLIEPFQRLSHHRSSPAFGFGAPAHGWGKYKVPNTRNRAAYLQEDRFRRKRRPDDADDAPTTTPGPGAHEVTPLQRDKGDFSLTYNSDRFRYTAPVYSFGLSDPLRESADIKLQETEKEERRLGRALTKEEAHTFPPAWKDDSRAHPGITRDEYEEMMRGTARFPLSKDFKRFSERTHALAWPYGSSVLDDPPPTHKPNIDLTKRQPPIVNVTQKRTIQKGGFWFRNSPGADAYKGENRHKILNHKEAIWKFGTEPKGNPGLSCLINKVSTPGKVGPGSYTHETSLIRNEHGKKW